MGPGRERAGPVVSQLTTFADVVRSTVLMREVLLAAVPLAVTEILPVTLPVVAPAVNDARAVRLGLMVPLVEPTQPEGMVIVVPLGKARPGELSVTVLEFLYVLFPPPLRVIVSATALVTVVLVHTLPNASPVSVTVVVTSPSATRLSAQAVGATRAAAAPTATAIRTEFLKTVLLLRVGRAATNRCPAALNSPGTARWGGIP